MAKFLTLFAVLLAARYYASSEGPAKPHPMPSNRPAWVDPSTEPCLDSISCEKTENPGKT